MGTAFQVPHAQMARQPFPGDLKPPSSREQSGAVEHLTCLMLQGSSNGEIHFQLKFHANSLPSVNSSLQGSERMSMEECVPCLFFLNPALMSLQREESNHVSVTGYWTFQFFLKQSHQRTLFCFQERIIQTYASRSCCCL